MLKEKINEGDIEELVVTGRMIDTISELSLVVSLIWSEIEKRDKKAGDCFKKYFKKVVEEKVFEENVLDQSDEKEEASEDRLQKVIEALDVISNFIREDDDDDADKCFKA